MTRITRISREALWSAATWRRFWELTTNRHEWLRRRLSVEAENGATGRSDMEGKAARVAANDLGKEWVSNRGLHG